jgi:alcohol dehydrogenase
VEAFDATSPGPGEVAIDVKAVGLNFADIFCRHGMYKAAPPLPFSPGFEVAGVVAETGDGASAFRTGDRVFAVTRFGGYTTRLHIGEEWVRPLPEGWSFADGAAFPVAYLTAYYGLVNLGRTAPGETVVVQSAAGGVGTAACALVRSLGGRVIGTVGSEGKKPVAEQAGAQDVIVDRDYRVWDAVSRLTDGRGVDVVFESVGGPQVRRGFEALRPGGRLLIYGYSQMIPGGARRNWPLLAWRYLRTPRFNPFRMTESNRSVAGYNIVHLWGQTELFRNAVSDLLARAERKEIRPFVGKTFPFHRVGDAQTFLQSRRSTGKVVLVTNE